MNRRPRTYYSETQRALMWERWKAGWTLHPIGHLIDRPHTSIHTVLSRTGGIRPPERRRSKAALSLGEREEISAHWWPAKRRARSLHGLDARHRPSAASANATVAEKALGPLRRIALLGIGHLDPSAVSSRRTGHWQCVVFSERVALTG
jgi:hypothetical protein